MNQRRAAITVKATLDVADGVDDDLLRRRLLKGVDYGLDSALEDTEGRVTAADIDIQLS